LTIAGILAWAEEHHRLNGTWPTMHSGRVIADGVNETWYGVNHALICGTRGLYGKTSLVRILQQFRGVIRVEPLSESKIVDWAADHFRRTGSWPTVESGAVLAGKGITWSGINSALRQGCRGLPGGSTLSNLLKTRGAIPIVRRWRPLLSRRQILDWAEAHFKVHGHWPHSRSGSIAGVPGETWKNVDLALRTGVRGLTGGLSLPRLLRAAKGVRFSSIGRQSGPPFSMAKILAWADAYFKKRGVWPHSKYRGRSPERPARPGKK